MFPALRPNSGGAGPVRRALFFAFAQTAPLSHPARIPAALCVTAGVVAVAFGALISDAPAGPPKLHVDHEWLEIAGLGAALLAVAFVGLAIAWFRLMRQKSAVALDYEARLAETQHRIGNTFSVIAAMLAFQSRQQQEPDVRRAIDQAARRIQVIAAANQMVERTASPEARIDRKFVDQIVDGTIGAFTVGGRVRHEVSVDAIDAPKAMLTPLALILNECVSNALEASMRTNSVAVIVVRLEAQGLAYGERRLTIEDEGAHNDLPYDEWVMLRSRSLPLVNALAVQLGARFQLEKTGERVARATLVF